MKKAYGTGKKHFVFLCLLSVCLVFLTQGCGLDVISVVLEDNVTTDTIPDEYQDIDYDYTGKTFKFNTHELTNANSFDSTSIYYKIYNNTNTLVSEVNSLTSVASDSLKKYTSVNNLRETYHYQKLRQKTGSVVKDFEILNEAKEIKIRLTTYDSQTEDYSAGIWVDGTKIGEPVRFVADKPFDFGKTSDNLPLTDEEDTYGFDKNKEEGATDYYVALFSVFQMLDDNVEEKFSPIHFLGRVKIDSGKEEN